MPHIDSASIIPFPARNARLAPADTEDPRLRLANALAALDAAVTRQRQAIADWRGAVGALQASVGGLGSSLHAYRDTLGALHQRVSDLNAQARALEATADRALRED